MTGREYRDAIEAELERAGIGDREFQYGGKHPRVVFVFNGKRCAHGYPSTPSDAVRGLAQNIAGGGLAPNYPFDKPEYHSMTNERDRPANERVVAALLKARPAIVRVLEDLCGTTELTADIVAERIDAEILRILDAEDCK